MSSLRAAFNRFWAGKDAFTVALGSSSGVLGLIGLYILLTRFKGSAARHRQSSSSTSSAHPQSRRRAELRDATLARAMRMARQLPGAQRMIDDQFDKVRVSLVKSLHKYVHDRRTAPL